MRMLRRQAIDLLLCFVYLPHSASRSGMHSMRVSIFDIRHGFPQSGEGVFSVFFVFVILNKRQLWQIVPATIKREV